MTKKNETIEERARRQFNYHAGIIELPFKFEDLPPEFQALFSEPPPLPTFKVEDVKPWVPIEKKPAFSLVEEYHRQSGDSDISEVVRSLNASLEGVEPDVEGFLAKLKGDLEK